MKKIKIFHCLLLSIAMFFFTSIAQAELKIDSVYPNVGEMGKELTVTVRGSGFDENTRVSVALDTGNQGKIVGSVDTPGEASGIDLAGNRIYVADRSNGLQIIDINESSVPTIIGAIDTPGTAQNLTVFGHYAYIADGESGLQVIDISNPSAPKIISSIDTPGYASDVAISKNSAFVADGENGLKIIDISNPFFPYIINTLDIPGTAAGITISKNLAYIADLTNGLQIIDISDLTAPYIASFYDIETGASDISISGELAYVAGMFSGLYIINISNPAFPYLVKKIETLGEAASVTLSERIAYVATLCSGLLIINVNDPSNSNIIGRIDTPGLATDAIVIEGRAYVTDFERGLQVIDISHPKSSNSINSVDTQGVTHGISISGNYAYIADSDTGLNIVDIHDPTAPYIIGAVDTPGDICAAVSVFENIAYVVDGYGLQLINIMDPAIPKIVGQVATPGKATDITVIDDIAYVADGPNGLQIIDVFDPTSPKIIGTLEMVDGYAWSISVSGNWAYVLDRDTKSVQIINIGNPKEPYFFGILMVSQYARNVTISDSYLYIADGYNGIHIIDISYPFIPNLISTIDTPIFAYNVTVCENRAYVADLCSGLIVIDISEPSSPNIVSKVFLQDDPQSIAVSENMAYIAGLRNGMTIVPLPSEITPLTVKNESEMTFTIPSPEIKGNYNIKIFNQTEADEMASAVTFSEPDTLSQLQTQKAIILAGSDNSGTSSFQQSTQLCTNYAYLALMTQGYPKENIRYLSAHPSDADGDGITDVDNNATYQNFKSALQDWASDAGDLLIYITGHGGDGKFEINGLTDPSEYVTDQELDTWLDLIQQNMTGKVILIYDACMSGSFIDRLEPPAGKERIVITSSSPEEPAWFMEKGALSFSYQFWASVILNANLYDSFTVAKNLMAGDQTCQINANGDTTPNDKTDQALARNIIIGRGRVAASSPPGIADVSDDQVLEDGSTSSIIQAYNIYGLNPIKRVWAVINPPSMENLSPETPVTDLPTIELEDPDGDGAYEGIYENFSEHGTYFVNVYAEDSEGLYAVPLQTSVTQTQYNDDSIIWNKIRDDLRIRAEINTVEKGLIIGQWQLGGQDTTARGDQVFWGYFYASPDDVTWGSENNPDLFVKIWVDVTGPIYVDYFHVSVPDITVYTDFNAGSVPAADQTHTATLTTRFVEHSFIDGQSDFTMQNEDGAKPAGYSETAAPYGCKLTNNLRIGSMINTVEKGPIEGIWSLGGQDTTARGDTVIWGHFYADPNEVTWGSSQNPDLFVKIWFDVGGTVNVDFFHVSVPDIEVYSELPADGTYDNSGTTVLGNRFIEHRYQWE